MNAMSQNTVTRVTTTVVEEEVHLTLFELCRACRAPEDQVRVWVVEGVLEPIGESPEEWRFTGPALRRARLALTLSREFEVNAPGVALALDLLDEINALKASLRRAGAN
jgi:chaperone modulatory protein CbpM